NTNTRYQFAIICVMLYSKTTHFFYSSRRRHTISKRDWSSDVCSSDLDELAFHDELDLLRAYGIERGAGELGADAAAAELRRHFRSEARRVGKDSKFRGLS